MPPRDYNITHGQKLLFGADIVLDWSDTPPPSPQGPMGQWRKFGISVTNGNNSVIASVPPKTEFFRCRAPRLNSVVQPAPGGLTAEPRQPAAGATGPRKLRLLPPIQEPQPVPPRRLQPRAPD